MKKKNPKMDTIMKELAEEKSARVNLSKQLEKANETIKALQMSLRSPRSESVDSVAFAQQAGPSSTQRPRNEAEAERSRFLTSVNQMSLASINVPECKPSVTGEQIGRRDYESWIDLLTDSLKLAGVEDEPTKFVVFKVKAGPMLLDIFKNTKSSPESPKEDEFPYANALSRLKVYFGSASDIMLQRRKLALMVQGPEESDLSFIMRVNSIARLCDYKEGKEFEEIVSAVATHARNKDVRIVALKMLNRQGSFTELVDAVREIEAVKMNEEYYRMQHERPEKMTVAAVSAACPKTESFRRPYNRRSVPRGRFGQPYAGHSRYDSQRSSGHEGERSTHKEEVYRCFRCDSVYHKAEACYAIDKTCLKCGRRGHIQRACRSIKTEQPRRTEEENRSAKPEKVASIELDVVAKAEEHADEPNLHVATFTAANTAIDEGIVKATVAGLECEFLIDSGAQVNTMTDKRFAVLCGDERYRSELFNVRDSTDHPLKAYATSGEIPVLATFEAFMHISDNRPTLLEKFYVVKECRSLLGRATATRYSVLLLGLQVPINSQTCLSNSWYEANEIAMVTADETFPKFNIPPVRINYDRTRSPCRNVFMNIPVALKPIVEKRLQQLLKAGIIEEVTEDMENLFCSSMLAIPKGKEDIRLVIDLRGPNSYIQRSPFAMPSLEKILAEIHGAQWFSTIDMTNAYFHIELDEDSRHLTNFCTEFGMFRCVRLPFGLCNAPDIFQEVLERKILGGCRGVKNYLDDIFVFGKTPEEHDENLAAVMARLREHNVKINEAKCVFKSQTVKFIGFKITPDGWQIEEEKMRAIEEFRTPETVGEVKSFLGLVTFVDKFVPHRATKTEKLRALANADTFYWSEAEDREFQDFKLKALKTIKTLGYFNSSDRTELFVDASGVGLGAVLIQFDDNETPRIIACASKALTNTEQRYPQTHREALAVVWGVERFAYYLSGRAFVIRTDAEANQFIFGGKHRIGKRAVSRAEAWALRLQPFDFTMERVPAEPQMQAPRFTTQPSSSGSMVNEGRTKILQCHALGYPQPMYRWLKNGIPVGDFDTSQYLKIQSTTREDAGSYQCLAKNDAGTIFSEKIDVVVAYMGIFEDLSEQVVSVQSGYPAILNLSRIESVPAPSVTWQTEDGPLNYDIKYATTAGNQLIILSVDENDMKSYRARAINTQIGKEEISAFIRVNVTGNSYSEVAPEIIVEPKSMKVVRGEQTVQLECIANARPLHELETIWLKDGIPIENSGISYAHTDPWNRTLALLYVNLTHTGQYTCQVQMRTGGYPTVHSVATVTVQEPPSFFTPFRTETLGDYGSKTVLPCDVIGEPVPYVTWFRNAEGLDLSTDRYTVQDDHSLVIKKLSMEDSAMFQCLASNEAGEKSSYTWLKVKNNTDRSSTPTVVLKHLILYNQFVRNKRLAQPRIIRVRNSASASDSAAVSINNTSSNNGKSSSTTNNNSNGNGGRSRKKTAPGSTASTSTRAEEFTFDIRPSVPIMEMPPTNLTVLDGKDATMHCRAIGAPTPNITWVFNESQGIELSGRIQILDSGDLLISNVRESDAGLYTCIRANEAGIVTEEAYLGVMVRTQIVQPPADTTVLLGHTAALQCRVSSDPTVPFNIDWYREPQRQPIKNSQRVAVKADGTLEIVEVRPSDVGQYSCIVTSPGGNETRSARLSVVELPFAPTNVQAVRLNTATHRAINISWTPGFDGNSAVLKFIIQRREVPELGPLPDPLLNWVTELSNVSAGSRWVLLTSLKAATAYQFRVSAVNRVGEGSPSDPSNVIKLPQEAPSGPPVGFVGSARSSSEIITQWQPPMEEHRNGQILGYIIRYRLFGYNASPWNYRNITNEAQRNYLIQELITWKDYIVQIAAYNNMGVGVYTDGAKIKTKEGVPEAPPTNVRVTALNSTAIRVWWKPPNPQQINGINQGYKIQAWRYEIIDGEEHETEAKVLTVPPSLLDPLAEQDTVVTGLDKFTMYNVTVLCFTDPGDGERSYPVEVKTMEDVPDEVSSLQFDDVSDREVTVMWTPPKQINGILTGYQVKYQIKDQPDTLKTFNLSADTNSLKIVNLMATTHYWFEVTASTAVGQGLPRTATIQSGVEPVLPHPPYQLALSNIEAFSVVIQFTPGFDGNSSITRWTVEGQTARNLTWFTVYEVHDPDASTLTVTGLTPFTPYRLRIIASNVVGPSEPSEPTKDFQTIQARPMHPPFNVTVRAMSATELRVRWIPLQQTEWFGNPRGYNITYRNVNEKARIAPFSVIIEDPTANSHVLDGLEEWSVYEIFMSAVNEVGQSNESPHAFERTREAVPSFGPLGVEANATSSTTIVVKWTEVPKEHRNGQIEGYKVFYGSAGRTQVLHKTISNNATFTTTLTELKKFVQYDIQVLAYTRLGDGSLSTPPVRVQTFEDTPGAPSNVSFPDVSFSMARIIWDVPEEPNGEILAYKVTYLLNGSQSLNFSREFPPSDRTFRATQLLAERYYLFSVTSQTRLGWGKTATVLVYTTNNREIPQAPSAPQISRSQVQAEQITFSWTPGRDGFAPLRYYTVQFQENEGPWTVIPERVDPFVTSYTALGLKPHTLYQFRIQATNDIGPSAFSRESIEVRTLPAAPSGGITGLKVVPITTTSVRVQWNPLKKSMWNGDANTGGYRILYQPISDFPSTLQSTPKLDVMGVEQESAILKDLTQDRNYEIIVQPFNSQGSGIATPPVAVYVGEAVPTGEPRGIDGAPVSSTEVRLRWKAPQQSMQNGELLGYKIFYLVTDSPQELEDGRKHEEEIEVVPASYTSHSLVFLDKYTEYRIQILAFNPAGDGPRSTPITVKTLQGLPGPPIALSFSDITMNSLKVSWDPPKKRNGEILGYIVTYETTEDNEKFSKQVKQKVSGTSLIIQNLEEEVTYTFTVRAQTIDYGPAVSGNVTTGPQDGSPVSPRDLQLSKSQASVDMAWLNGPSGKGPILGYYIETKKRDMEQYYNHDTRWETVARTTNGPIQEFTVSFQSLLPSTAYKFRVIAYNRYGISCPVYSDDAILTPSKLYLEYGYLQQKPFYRQTWFMVALAATSIIIIIMVIAVLCVKSKSYKYKQEAQKTLEESMAMSIDERQELALELYRSRHGVTSQNGTLNGTGTLGRRTGTILGSRKPQTSAAAAASMGKSPPRPSPASVAYHSDEESLKCYDENPDDSSVTEKPSEVSSSDSQASESENESVRSDPHSFVNHYANVNDSLRQSWKRQKPVRNYSSYTDSEPEGSAVMSLNGGQIIMNNMARSRAPLPGFSSFV